MIYHICCLTGRITVQPNSGKHLGKRILSFFNKAIGAFMTFYKEMVGVYKAHETNLTASCKKEYNFVLKDDKSGKMTDVVLKRPAAAAATDDDDDESYSESDEEDEDDSD